MVSIVASKVTPWTRKVTLFTRKVAPAGHKVSVLRAR
jgi:hypothetical protein